METHSRILAWKIPWAEQPNGLQSMGSQSQTLLIVCTHTHTHTHTQMSGTLQAINDLQMDGQ